jgi:triphosphatase
LLSGSLADLFTLAQDWSARHGLWVSTASSSECGSLLAAGHPEGFPTTAIAPVDAMIADGATFLVATLDSCLAQIVGNISAVGEGAPDRHVIDQLRHGLERIRTALGELSSIAPDIDAAWAPVFKRTFHELASHRGAPPLGAPLIQEMRAAGLGYAYASAHPRDTRTPAEIVRDPEFQKVLIELLAYRHSSASPMRSDKSRLKQMRKRFGVELEACKAKVARDAARLSSTASRRRASRHLDQLVRLAAFAAPLYNVRDVDGFLVRCRTAQDAFSVAREHRAGFDALMDDGETGADVKLARRWLAARLSDDRAQCETLLHRAGKAASFWAA